MSGRGAPGGGGSPRTGPSGPEIRLETTRDGEKSRWRRKRPQWRGAARRGNLVGRKERTLPFHPEGVEASGTARGRASRRARMDSPGCRLSGRAWVAPPTDGLVLYSDVNSSPSSVQSSESKELPARQPAHSKASRMSGRGSYLREQVPCPKCGS